MFSVGILTISDKGSRGEREDKSGQAIREFVEKQGWKVKHYRVIPDEMDKIKNQLKQMADQHHCDLILTTGGTGLSPRDLTPEATKAVIEREVPGLAEYMRAKSLKKIAAVLRSDASYRRASVSESAIALAQRSHWKSITTIELRSYFS